jgi:hypothetical protein
MSQSVSPNDHWRETCGESTINTNRLSVFVICPSRPQEVFDGIFELVEDTCAYLAQHLGVEVHCKRAVDITSAGIIHPEIWQSIRDADLVVADISGCNGNVMMELGVAAAWLRKEQVIIIRQDQPEEQRLFDISAARHIDYRLTPRGIKRLQQQLLVTVQEGLTAAPFRVTSPPHLALPTSIDFKSGRDVGLLWGPSMAHRRLMPEGYLEFGSLYNFRHSWLCAGDVSIRNARVRAAMRFCNPRQTAAHLPWIGVMVRSQGYLANFGHLAYLKADGSIWITLEENGGQQHHDEQVGQLTGFNVSDNRFLPFEVSMDDAKWRLQIGDFGWERAISDLPYVYGEGRILVQGFFTWVGLREFAVEPASA